MAADCLNANIDIKAVQRLISAPDAVTLDQAFSESDATDQALVAIYRERRLVLAASSEGRTFFYFLGFGGGWTLPELVALILRLVAAAGSILIAAIAIRRDYSWHYWPTSSLVCAVTITGLTLLIQGHFVVRGIISNDWLTLTVVALSLVAILIHDIVALALFRRSNRTSTYPAGAR